MGTGGAVVLTYGARKYRDFVFQGKDECLVHHDKSVVKIPIKSQVPATVQIVHPAADAEGKTSVTIVDKEKVLCDSLRHANHTIIILPYKNHDYDYILIFLLFSVQRICVKRNKISR